MRVYLSQWDEGLFEPLIVVYVGEDKERALRKINEPIKGHNYGKKNEFEVQIWDDGELTGRYIWNHGDEVFYYEPQRMEEY